MTFDSRSDATIKGGGDSSGIQRIELVDRVVGSVSILGIFVGFMGNGSAACFFWPRRNKTIHNVLYLAVTVVNCLTFLYYATCGISAQ